ncbi:SBBP repeat-containing protein [Myxococcus stipitatus]|uniref:SBBP repeat-containing protein n=1 Tax=Myxococcus stipitatus TaxID=83455 RepID=UPI001F1AE9B0|nr:SBBP repeat-containing protein [Myxococcus stipitatus]MCE9672437.1 SBBP repeat-containing protein [Myxococcus stipitatus]
MGDLEAQADGHVAVLGTQGSDLVVARFDPTGQLLWRRRIGDANYQQGTGLALDSAGNVVITGDFWGDLDFGGGPLPCRGEPGYPRAFVAKLDTTGAHVWSRCFGDGGQQQTGSIVVGPNDDVLVGGYFAGTIDFGDGPIPANGTMSQFVARLAGADGATLWNTLYDAGGVSTLGSIAVDVEDNVVVAAAYWDQLSYQGVPLLSVPGFNTFVLRLDAHGKPLWARGFGPASTQTLWRLATDGDGNILGAGAFIGSVNFGGATLYSPDGDAFVVSLDAEGGHRWSRRFGGAGFDWGYDVAVDAEGNALVTGAFSGTIDFGTGTLTSQGGDDIYVAKLDRDGQARWSRSFGNTSNQSGLRVIPAGRWDAVLWGRLAGTLDFGSGPVSGFAPSDTFLARITPP